mmetsp:Transcript_16350/g.18886  ORF Transcript_16350/g.18886 Transcript_16350/m.18886 type:complete len:115 (+) Transcript_16350:654-998(+)
MTSSDGTTSQSNEKKKLNRKGIKHSELKLLNVLIPSSKRFRSYQNNSISKKKEEDQHICHKELGESNYEDWFKFKRHDLTSTIPINTETTVKNHMETNLIIRQLNSLIESTEIK